MTEATDALPARNIRPAESRLIAGICAAHMMSHYYMLMLAPLLAFIRDDFNVSYTELALALTVFNVVSGLLQTPAMSRDSAGRIERTEMACVIVAGWAPISISRPAVLARQWPASMAYRHGGCRNRTVHR